MTLLDQATPLCSSDDVNPPLCERCNKPGCRTASHTDSQRSDSQRQGDQQKVGKTPALVTLGTSPPKQYDFDWSGEDVIIHEQPATAVYFNPQGALVIRQRASDYDYHDPFVYIGPDHIEAFLDKLCDVCGIPSVGRRT